MANFEAFCWNISLSANLFFLKCGTSYISTCVIDRRMEHDQVHLLQVLRVKPILVGKMPYVKTVQMELIVARVKRVTRGILSEVA